MRDGRCIGALQWIVREFIVVVATVLSVVPALVGVACVAYVVIVLYAAMGAIALTRSFFNWLGKE